MKTLSVLGFAVALLIGPALVSVNAAQACDGKIKKSLSSTTECDGKIKKSLSSTTECDGKIKKS
jgi:hypothetical protein